MDIFDKKTRSYIMSRIRNKWTKQEIYAHNLLKGHKVRHRMHPDLPGHPDIMLKGKRTVIFLHGCFWHGHEHCRVPDNDFWREKIRANKKRHNRNVRILRKMGYKVLTIWECGMTKRKLLSICGRP